MNQNIATHIDLTFDSNLDPTTANKNTVVLHRFQGSRNVNITTNGANLTIDSINNFFPGELVEVTVTNQLKLDQITG